MQLQKLVDLFSAFNNDTNGFVISGELVLVSTIGVLSVIVGLSELSYNVNQELEDVGSALSCISQSYQYSLPSGHKGSADGSSYDDILDPGSSDTDITCSAGASPEQ